MIKINFIFSLGFRCYCNFFLQKYELRKISGPFDHLFIDIETSFENINNNFEKFLKDIVLINNGKKLKKIFYSTKNIDEKILELDKPLHYMRDNYQNKDLLINQNFIDNVSYNLYEWKRICVFLHHDIIDPIIYNKIKKRVEIFKQIYKNNKNICLLYITRIIENDDINKYKEYILNLKKKYNIQCYITIIICSSKFEDDYNFENNILYIIKKVDNYQSQVKKGTDNNILSFKKEYDIMNDFFNFELNDYKEIISNYT